MANLAVSYTHLDVYKRQGQNYTTSFRCELKRIGKQIIQNFINLLSINKQNKSAYRNMKSAIKDQDLGLSRREVKAAAMKNIVGAVSP